MPTPSEDLIRQIPSLSERLEHYHVPEGYFDDLFTRILAQIPLDEQVPAADAVVAPSAHRRAKLWVRLRPWTAIAAALIAVVALWGVWQVSTQEPLRSSDEVASSVYDLSVTPLTDAEYADYLYETCVDILIDDYAIGETLEGLSSEEI
ncbi:MAG: hypothetical protein SOW36_02145 [Porphyromonas sp.]|uniref:hypothetical protein n=1 Tax=Porphyromonas sp. TaxID=1924944 RepID=UPI002A74A3FC|nr:hypothetical protein [Porphyromonas sp.]MDD6928999.1 hypothetical protein [Bacteroidales bacterium]MDY3111430.1 hypothetical protein [Porphyromonas sp.]MDY4246384.1 hypothetical protein [Porphyromonas sp.]